MAVNLARNPWSCISYIMCLLSNSLAVLRLDGNRLTTYPVWHLSGNPSLVAVNLAGNPWSCISNIMCPLPRSLAVLRLDGNRLTTYPVWHLSANPSLVAVNLAGNPWSCDCEYVNQFLVYTWRAGSKIQVFRVMVLILNGSS